MPACARSGDSDHFLSPHAAEGGVFLAELPLENLVVLSQGVALALHLKTLVVHPHDVVLLVHVVILAPHTYSAQAWE